MQFFHGRLVYYGEVIIERYTMYVLGWYQFIKIISVFVEHRNVHISIVCYYLQPFPTSSIIKRPYSDVRRRSKH